MGNGRHLLLVGGGHAQVEVLRKWAQAPLEGWRVTLLTRSALSPYSGMLPGVIAGLYRAEEAMIDTRALAARAGAALILDSAIGIDLPARRLHRTAGPHIRFDLLSIDTGATPDLDRTKGAARHALPIKPIDALLPRLDTLLRSARPGMRVAVVGGGAAGVEIALALRTRLPDAVILLVAGAAGLLPEFPAGLRARVSRAMTSRRVTLDTGADVQEVTESTLHFADRRILAVDATIWATGAAAPPWLAETGLARDPLGFLRVDEHLRALGHGYVFAAGDVASWADGPLPKAGVFAVRQGPVLAANLCAVALGGPLIRYRPQTRYLTLLSLGDGHAIGTRNGLVAGGRWIGWLKDRIDRAFMARYSA